MSEGDRGDPREIFRLLWRRKWILLACVTLIPAAVYLYSDRLDKTYEATAVVQIQTVADASDVLTGNIASGNNAAVARLAGTSAVADEISRILKQPQGSARGAVSGVFDEDTGFITITAKASTADQAAAIANAAGQAVGDTRERRGVRRASKAITGVQRDLSKLSGGAEAATERQQLSEQLQKLRTLRAAQGGNAQVIEPAAVPTEPVSPKPRRNALLAFVLAALLAVGLVVLIDRMDRKLRDADQVERLVDAPLLAVIPREAFPGGRPSARLPFAFQGLRDSLTYFNVDETLKTIVVTSALKGEGKTTVATNLAVSIARTNKRVILLDADLRRPQVAKRMGIEGPTGLSNVLLGERLEDALREIPPFGDWLRVLPAGPTPPNPSELLGSKRMGALLERARGDRRHRHHRHHPGPGGQRRFPAARPGLGHRHDRPARLDPARCPRPDGRDHQVRGGTGVRRRSRQAPRAGRCAATSTATGTRAKCRSSATACARRALPILPASAAGRQQRRCSSGAARLARRAAAERRAP